MKLERPIETPRLILRSYRDGEEDRNFCVSLWCDPETGRYMADPVFERIDEKYLSFFNGMEDDPDGYYLIAESKATGAPVGTFCMFPENGNFDIGYCIAPELQRQGLGSEMIAAVLRYIADHGGVSVTAEVADENAASRGLLRKYGFSEFRKGRFKKRNEDLYFDSRILRLELKNKETIHEK